MAQLDLATLYARHRQGLFTHALLITRQADRAEDAVHEAFARLCGKMNVAQIADPVAYVFTAVRRAAIDEVRRRRPDAAPVESIFAADRPEHHAEQTERSGWIAAALDELMPDQREVVVLKIYAGLTFAQIAAVTGEPLQTVATRYRRSLELLRGRLEKLV